MESYSIATEILCFANNYRWLLEYDSYANMMALGEKSQGYS
jgi:hypothetical protein